MTNVKMNKDLQQMKLSCTARSIKLYNSGKHLVSFLNNLNILFHCDPIFSLLDAYPKEMKTYKDMYMIIYNSKLHNN